MLRASVSPHVNQSSSSQGSGVTPAVLFQIRSTNLHTCISLLIGAIWSYLLTEVGLQNMRIKYIVKKKKLIALVRNHESRGLYTKSNFYSALLPSTGRKTSPALPQLSAMHCTWTWVCLSRFQISILISTITILCITVFYKQVQIKEPWNIDYAVCKTASHPKKLPCRHSKPFKTWNNVILLKYKLF